MGATRSGKSWRKSAARALLGVASLVRGSGRPLFIVAALVGLSIGGAFYARHRWPELLPQHRLSAKQILVTPQASWIHADVKAEVLRDAGLAEFDLLERDLTNRIAEAFAAHTWVAEVRRVVKRAGPQIDVELVYRRPVAMVEVISSGRPGLLPVDEQSVLLPPEDFSPNQARNYLRLTILDSKPAGPIGTAWGDPRVLGAARIAAAWHEKQWKSLGLYRIEAVDAEGELAASHLASSVYTIYSREGRRIHWGHAPGEEHSGEATASQKIARLIAHVEANGPLDEQGAADLDLRDAQSIREVPRTARLGGR